MEIVAIGVPGVNMRSIMCFLQGMPILCIELNVDNIARDLKLGLKWRLFQRCAVFVTVVGKVC
jgi:hypothetical protein